MNDYSKEDNYSACEDPNVWSGHANVGILEDNKNCIYGDILDIGCNNGTVTHWLTKNSSVKSITGIDINKSAIEAAKRIFQKESIPNKFVCINFTEQNLVDFDFSYDCIISFHTFEHIWPEHTPIFIRNAYSRLKSGGHFIISIPYEHAYGGPSHVGFYKEDTLPPLFEREGFITKSCFLDNRWREQNLLTGTFQK